MEITHNNKTYRWIGDKWGMEDITKYDQLLMWGEWVYFFYWKWFGFMSISTNHTPEQLVKLGYMKEVKDNKEPRTFTIWFDEYEAIKKNASILEKLREEIVNRITTRRHKETQTKQEDDQNWWGVIALNSLLGFLDSLTSLEQSQTKEDRTQQTKDITGMLELCMDVKPIEQPKEEAIQMGAWNWNREDHLNYLDARTDEEKARDLELYRIAVTTTASTAWTPTPWQMIEVSNDGKKWYEAELEKIEPYPWIPSKKYKIVGNRKVGGYFEYARPITEEVIVPEFKAIDHTPEPFSPWPLLLQVEAITQWIHSQSNKR